MGNIDWSPLVNGIIALLGIVLTCYIVPLLKASLTEKQLNAVRISVNTAVLAAEQMFASKEGEAKKQWVIDYLVAHNITLDEEQLSALIEEVVYEINRVEDKSGPVNPSVDEEPAPEEVPAE